MLFSLFIKYLIKSDIFQIINCVRPAFVRCVLVQVSRCHFFVNVSFVILLHTGSKYSYSNLGYLILGRVVEKCSGDSYEVYVQNLLKKLGVVRMQLGKTFKDAAHPDEVRHC